MKYLFYYKYTKRNKIKYYIIYNNKSINIIQVRDNWIYYN